MSTPKLEALKPCLVTQADREAAARVYQNFRDHDYAKWVSEGTNATGDADWLIQAFALHRTRPATSAEPVAWRYWPSADTDELPFAQLHRANMDPRYWTETPLYASPPAHPAVVELAKWLDKIADLDLTEIVADGGITAGMVVQQEAREQARRLRTALAAMEKTNG